MRMAGLLQAYAKPFTRDSGGSFVLPPGKFALGITHEWIELPRRSKIAARVEGRSTLARLGLAIHMTAPIIHAGFEGRIVLEMYNFGPYPLRLRPREFAVCQLIFERLGRVPRSKPHIKVRETSGKSRSPGRFRPALLDWFYDG
jgi:dCTP deaminase